MLQHEIINLTEKIVNEFEKSWLINHDKMPIYRDLIKAGIEDFFSKQIAVIWTVEDVMKVANEEGFICDVELANSILNNILENVDANVGISWHVIREELRDTIG